jgi:hypothetical protein
MCTRAREGGCFEIAPVFPVAIARRTTFAIPQPTPSRSPPAAPTMRSRFVGDMNSPMGVAPLMADRNAFVAG